jgi:uncharacterized RDD family membrane protein YckC
MKVWRLQLQSISGQPLSWQQILVRFLIGIVSWLAFGLGFFWAIVDKQHRTWHDQVSDTCVVLLPK